MSLKKSKTECGPIEWEVFLLLIDRLKKDSDYKMLLLFSIGCYCGLRISDILSLCWRDVIFRDSFELSEMKTGKHRLITINGSLKEIIEHCHNHLNPLPDSYIFNNRSGRHLTKQFINRKLHATFRKYRVKVKNGSSHTLRKTFGCRVYEINHRSEAALVLLSNIFNHNSVAVTRRYIGLSEEQIKDVYINL